MGYYIDLKSISLDNYKNTLKTSYLLPSRKMLQKNIDQNFELIKNQQIVNIENLFNVLKTKKKLQIFSIQSGVETEYLTILFREIKSNRPNPTKIKDFSNISEELVLKLENLGIKNMLQLFDKIISPQSRKNLSQQSGINEDDILKIVKLCDLTRIRWVNHTFAFVLYEAKFDSLEKVANADYKELYESIKLLNEKRQL